MLPSSATTQHCQSTTATRFWERFWALLSFVAACSLFLVLFCYRTAHIFWSVYNLIDSCVPDLFLSLVPVIRVPISVEDRVWSRAPPFPFPFHMIVSDGCHAWASSGEWENIYSHMETEIPAQLLIGTEYNATGQRVFPESIVNSGEPNLWTHLWILQRNQSQGEFKLTEWNARGSPVAPCVNEASTSTVHIYNGRTTANHTRKYCPFNQFSAVMPDLTSLFL